MLFSLVSLLVACGDEAPKDTSPADTSDTVDTGVTDDTSATDTSNTDTADTTDTGDTSDTGGDTSDTSGGDTGEVEPLPACDLLTPYRGCTATGVSTDIRGYHIVTWDAEGRIVSENVYTDATYTALSRRTVYVYTDGLLTSVEYRGSADDLQYTATYRYDSSGNLLSISEDTTARASTRYTYDSAGRMISWERTSSGRGSGCNREWTSTATGADYRETCSDGGDYTGAVDTRMLETLRVGVVAGTGTEFERTERVFRRDCQPASAIATYPTRGGDTTRAYAYDASGRLTGETITYPEESVVHTLTRTYTCPS
jgi:YD repeat-containing protein